MMNLQELEELLPFPPEALGHVTPETFDANVVYTAEI